MNARLEDRYDRARESTNTRANDLLADAIRSDENGLCQRIAMQGLSCEDAKHIEALAKDAWRDALNRKPSDGGREL